MAAPHTVRSGRAGDPHMNRRRFSGNADKPAARSPTNDASPCKGRLSDDDATSGQITVPQRSRSIVAGVLQDCCAAPGTGGGECQGTGTAHSRMRCGSGQNSAHCSAGAPPATATAAGAAAAAAAADADAARGAIATFLVVGNPRGFDDCRASIGDCDGAGGADTSTARSAAASRNFATACASPSA